MINKVRNIGHDVRSLHFGNQNLNKKIDIHKDLANEIQATSADLTDEIIKVRQIMPDEFDVTGSEKDASSRIAGGQVCPLMYEETINPF